MIKEQLDFLVNRDNQVLLDQLDRKEIMVSLETEDQMVIGVLQVQLVQPEIKDQLVLKVKMVLLDCQETQVLQVIKEILVVKVNRAEMLSQVSLEQLGLLELLETEAFQDKVDSLVKLVPREIMDHLVLLDCRVLWVMWDFQGCQALLDQQETPELLVHLETKVFLEIKEIQEIQVIQVEMPAHRWDPQDLQVPRVHKAQLVLQEVKAALVIVEVQVIQDKQVMLAVLDP